MTAGPAATLNLVSGNGQSGTVSQALSSPLVVKVTDANGIPVSGVTVTFAVTAGGGSLNATTVTTNGQGLAYCTLTLGAVAGPNTVSASSGSLTGSPVTFTATGVAASTFSVRSSSQSGLREWKRPGRHRGNGARQPICSRGDRRKWQSGSRNQRHIHRDFGRRIGESRHRYHEQRGTGLYRPDPWPCGGGEYGLRGIRNLGRQPGRACSLPEPASRVPRTISTKITS